MRSLHSRARPRPRAGCAGVVALPGLVLAFITATVQPVAAADNDDFTEDGAFTALMIALAFAVVLIGVGVWWAITSYRAMDKTYPTTAFEANGLPGSESSMEQRTNQTPALVYAPSGVAAPNYTQYRPQAHQLDGVPQPLVRTQPTYGQPQMYGQQPRVVQPSVVSSIPEGQAASPAAGGIMAGGPSMLQQTAGHDRNFSGFTVDSQMPTGAGARAHGRGLVDNNYGLVTGNSSRRVDLQPLRKPAHTIVSFRDVPAVGMPSNAVFGAAGAMPVPSLAVQAPLAGAPPLVSSAAPVLAGSGAQAMGMHSTLDTSERKDQSMTPTRAVPVVAASTPVDSPAPLSTMAVEAQAAAAAPFAVPAPTPAPAKAHAGESDDDDLDLLIQTEDADFLVAGLLKEEQEATAQQQAQQEVAVSRLVTSFIIDEETGQGSPLKKHVDPQ